MSDVECLEARLRKRLEPDAATGCWLWMGEIDPQGYGRLTAQMAHRLVYTAVRGPIPDGLQLDHLCRVRNCVNPTHLEPVTGKVNTLRGQTIPAANAAKTHCKNGHPFSAENTYVYPASGKRLCRACQRKHCREYQARRCAALRARRELEHGDA